MRGHGTITTVRRARLLLLVALAAIGGAGCGSDTTSATPAVSQVPTGSATVTTAPTATPTATAAPTAVADLPLGRPAGAFSNGRGFGQVKPSEIFNGGDPTGDITSITWSSWGGAQATGTGTGYYVGPGQPVAAAVPATVTVVAFKVGSCDGTMMYQAVEWYFPDHGGVFDPSRYEDICNGTYVPAA